MVFEFAWSQTQSSSLPPKLPSANDGLGGRTPQRCHCKGSFEIPRLTPANHRSLTGEGSGKFHLAGRHPAGNLGHVLDNECNPARLDCHITESNVAQISEAFFDHPIEDVTLPGIQIEPGGRPWQYPDRTFRILRFSRQVTAQSAFDNAS